MGDGDDGQADIGDQVNTYYVEQGLSGDEEDGGDDVDQDDGGVSAVRVANQSGTLQGQIPKAAGTYAQSEKGLETERREVDPLIVDII